jgi:hypothetical protein
MSALLSSCSQWFRPSQQWSVCRCRARSTPPLPATLGHPSADASGLPYVTQSRAAPPSGHTTPSTPSASGVAAVTSGVMSPPAGVGGWAPGPPSHPVVGASAAALGDSEAAGSERKLFSALRSRLGQLRPGNSSGRRDAAQTSPGASGKLTLGEVRAAGAWRVLATEPPSPRARWAQMRPPQPLRSRCV